MRLSFLYLLLLLAFIPYMAVGQEGDTRTCRILYHSAPAGAPKTLHLFDGESCFEAELPKMNLSKVYTLRKGPLKLRMLSETIADAQAVPEGAPSVEVPEDLQHIYLLVSHDPKNKVTPVKMEVINASYEEIKLGEMLWINYTKSTVSGTIGSRELFIKPAEQVLIKEPVKGRKGYPVKMNYSVSNDDVFLPLTESRWRHDPGSRFLALIVEDDRRKSPRIITFSDYRIQKKE